MASYPKRKPTIGMPEGRNSGTEILPSASRVVVKPSFVMDHYAVERLDASYDIATPRGGTPAKAMFLLISTSPSDYDGGRITLTWAGTEFVFEFLRSVTPGAESPREGGKNSSRSDRIAIGIRGYTTRAEVAARALHIMQRAQDVYSDAGFPMIYQGIVADSQTYEIARQGMSSATGVMSIVISTTGYKEHFGKSAITMIDPRYARMNQERGFRTLTYDLSLSHFSNLNGSASAVYAINFRDRNRTTNSHFRTVRGETDGINYGAGQLVETQDTIQAPFSVYNRTIRGT